MANVSQRWNIGGALNDQNFSVLQLTLGMKNNQNRRRLQRRGQLCTWHCLTLMYHTKKAEALNEESAMHLVLFNFDASYQRNGLCNKTTGFETDSLQWYIYEPHEGGA
jgi:hypothetical protein